MKTLLILLSSLTMYGFCFGQKSDTIHLYDLPFLYTDTTNTIMFSIYDEPNYVQMDIDVLTHDTTIYVVGDTMIAIKGLFKMWADKQMEVDEWKTIAGKYRQLLLDMEAEAKKFLKPYTDK